MSKNEKEEEKKIRDNFVNKYGGVFSFLKKKIPLQTFYYYSIKFL
jgi:hypothetical protein